jgi:RES domain-containing protein
MARAIDPANLPPTWRAWPAPAELRAIGDAWARQKRSLILEVPSAIVPQERNYLVNPAHPDFGTLTISAAQPFTFDARF